MERVANISGGVGVIHVGANSDIEQKEKYDRVDDAVRAVGAALEEGILPGGGIALARALENIKDDGKDKEYTAAADIMVYAMAKPIVQIIMNSGLDYEFICDNLYKKKFDYGYDVKNKKYGSMYKMGVIDPALVTKSALKNAVSVATTIMSTQAIITNMREDDNEKC
jgi:chaperonin GroEL